MSNNYSIAFPPPSSSSFYVTQSLLHARLTERRLSTALVPVLVVLHLGLLLGLVDGGRGQVVGRL